jgi:hypothetical protein
MFDERGKISDLPFLAVDLDLPKLIPGQPVPDSHRPASQAYPNIVISSSGGQTPLAVGFEVC